MKTQVLFSFDTEDYTTQRNADAILGLANMLSEEGVVGHFAVVGLLAKQLLDWGRSDVIDALKRHIIGYHSYGHSMHPTMAELSDIEDYAEARRRVDAVETKGLELLRKTFGDKKIFYSVPPGDDFSYTAQYFYAEQGIPMYWGGYVHDEENTLIDYCGTTQIPYTISMEEIFISEPNKDVDALLDKFSKCRRVIFYHHPNMSVSKEFWDIINYQGHNRHEFNDWQDAPMRTLGETITFWSKFRNFIRRLKSDDRFTITDANAILNERQQHQPADLTPANIGIAISELEAKFAPTSQGYCVSDVFFALAQFLRGEKSCHPTLARGFLDVPQGIAKPTVVFRDDVIKAAASINVNDFVPTNIQVGDSTIGPADFLFAMAQALNGDSHKITLLPRPQQVTLDDMPELKNYKMNWCIFSPDFKDTYLSERLRLQNWTWRRFNC